MQPEMVKTEIELGSCSEKEKFCKDKFYGLLEKRRKRIDYLPEISYGSALLIEQESICDTKARADQRMYENKREHKANKQQKIF
jgi:hypothetical protein